MEKREHFKFKELLEDEKREEVLKQLSRTPSKNNKNPQVTVLIKDLKIISLLMVSKLPPNTIVFSFPL